MKAGRNCDQHRSHTQKLEAGYIRKPLNTKIRTRKEEVTYAITNERSLDCFPESVTQRGGLTAIAAPDGQFNKGTAGERLALSSQHLPITGEHPMRLNSRLILERHTYAPELNRLHVYTGRSPHRPAQIRTPQAQTLKEARKQLRLTPATPVILATVSTHYKDPDLQWLNRSYTGTVTSRREALRFKRDVVTQRIIDEEAVIKVTTKLVNC